MDRSSPRPARSPSRIYGKYGTVDLGGEPVLRANGEMKPDFKVKNDGKVEAKLAVQPRRDLLCNLLDVIRG